MGMVVQHNEYTKNELKCALLNGEYEVIGSISQ